MTARPSILVPHDDSKPRQTISRHTVTFSDDFNPRAPDAFDNTVPSILDGAPNGLSDPINSTLSRRNSSTEPSVVLDDDESPRITRRNTGSYGPTYSASKIAVNPPSVWHPAGVVYRFVILSCVAFILATGYFSDETIGATNSALRTYDFRIIALS